MYTFYFLYSSCGCTSKGLPAIGGLTVSVSTTLKVTLQPTSAVGRLSPGLSIHLQTLLKPPSITPPLPKKKKNSFNDFYFRTFSGRGGVECLVQRLYTYRHSVVLEKDTFLVDKLKIQSPLWRALYSLKHGKPNFKLCPPPQQ